MKTAEFIEILRADGERVAQAARDAGWDAAVPTCPEWRMRELVTHLGNVHRWATVHVAGATEPRPFPEDRPADAELDAWFRAGLRALVEELSGAPADRECWTFLATAATPVAFWARRQAHETAIHRFDAESARPGGHAPMPAGFALDGIDELLVGFHAHPRSRVRTETPRTIRVRATAPEGDQEWLVRLTAEPARVERGAAPGAADCVISGPATDLYLTLWNRAGFESAEITGDAGLAELWRGTSAI